MREIETIIVGGGPAGSTCATELLAHGRRCLLLERQAMPRPKLCAGWITPKVLSDLGIQPADYPYGMLELRRFRLILGRRHQFVRTIATRQYSVRRIEFDPWLLARSETEVVRHTVRTIRREQDAYVIDDAFRCRYLVGAGGTACPVKKSLFPEDQGRLIITREIEYPCTPRYPVCTVWYPFAGNLGYAWYVPKAGAVNVGFGLAHSSAEKRDLKALWLEFVGLLRRTDCIDSDPPEPKGHPYYCGDRRKQLRRDNAAPAVPPNQPALGPVAPTAGGPMTTAPAPLGAPGAGLAGMSPASSGGPSPMPAAGAPAPYGAMAPSGAPVPNNGLSPATPIPPAVVPMP